MELACCCIQKQHQRHKQLYDKHAPVKEFDVGDRVWLYTPAVKPGQTKKLSSLWKGPYTVIDKCGPVDYRIQLIGGTQVFVVHRDRLKLCCGAPSLTASSHTPTSMPTTFSAASECVNNDSDSIGGYTTVPASAQDAPPDPPTCPQRNRRPPMRYGDYVSFNHLRGCKD